ncbi:MAG: toll/interleukin-1 receptor domain-containing protein [Planctomycetota bacterium]|jgi:hypothetical protein
MSGAEFVFISASHKDRDFVDSLAKDLLARGVDVWLPTSNIAPGTDWKKQISDALGDAAALIFVSSRNSESTGWSWQLYEVGLFESTPPKPVVLLILDEIGSNIPFKLPESSVIDFRQDYNLALDRLVDTLPPEVVRSVPKPEQPQKSKGYIFLSYAEEDSGFVEDLKMFLAERKYAYWDYEESERDYHTQLFRELEKAITEATATVSVVSPAWKRSRWTIREYFFSEDAGVPVLLVQAQDPGPTLATAGMPYIDFVKDRDAGYNKLSRELDRKGL